jgi:hypothetical protein
MEPHDFRRLALALEGVIESAHMGHPDFRVNNRIFATLHAGGRFGMVKLTPEQQQEFIDRHPDVFTPEAGAWGRAGCTGVRMEPALEEALGEALSLAWQNSAHKVKAKRSKRQTSTKPAQRSGKH